nr:MAG TPA: hypothetical protein [Caudoviricetes sp.]
MIAETSGAAYFYIASEPTSMANEHSNASAQMGFNASRVSSLYQDNLTEVRVNALFGLQLIRAY